MHEEDLTRDKIIQGAKVLFERSGLKKTTMDDIAQSVGMGKSSLYYYFKSKDDVFTAVLHDELARLRSAVDLEVKKKKNLQQQLIAYAEAYYEELIPRQNLYRIVSQEDNGAGSKVRLKMIIDAEVDYLISLIEEGSGQKKIPEITEQALQTFAEATIYAIYGIINYSFLIDGKINKEKFSSMVNLLMLRLV